MSTPVVIEVIEHCWATIEPYIDLISLISVSKSCNKLRQLVVDDNSGKIKASILKVPYDLDEDCPYGPISEHGPRLLNIVHFPSLVKLDISFPSIHYSLRTSGAVNENDFPLALPILARKLEDASNLEVFKIDVTDLILYEDGGRPQVAYNILKNNLIHKKKLRTIIISNSGGAGVVACQYSTPFLDAMVPVIQECTSCLEEIRLFCGGAPSSSNYPNAMLDFFEAALSLPNLKQFHINTMVFREYAPLLNSFMGACQSIQNSRGWIASNVLKGIGILIKAAHDDQSELHLQSVMYHFFSILSKVNSLKMIMLMLPLTCWNGNGISALSSCLESSSSSLKYVCLHFEGYKDGSGKQLLKFLLKIVNGKSDFQSNFQGIGYLADQDNSFKALVPFVEKVENKDEITWEFGYIPEKWRKKKDAKASA